ncbi:MAG: endolytic transglycosylase MltG [Gallionella sp.]|nr:endolytic transglycosylase MltG [Gallionella sp.]
MLQKIVMRFLALLGIVVVLAGLFIYYAYSRPALPSTPYTFTIKSGSSVASAARQLQDAHVIQHESLFVLLVRIMGQSARIKSGRYTLEHAISPRELVTMLAQGASTQRQVTVIEGWTFRQFRAVLNASPDLKHDSLALTDVELLQRIGAVYDYPEGLFFPDTYAFEAGSSDLAVLKRAYQTMQKRLQTAWENRDPDLPLQTPYQALILASIVEKETGAARDRDMIAGVFTNRLRHGMRLQTDPSVIYGLGANFDGNLRKVDLLTDTIYNTYTRAGLTPTPISLPGAAALHAALHPAPTTAVYFVARGDGSSEFSSNLTEHNRAVNRFQK